MQGRLKKMKSKHNKRRNTALLYEVLVRELTKSVLAEKEDQKKIILKIIKEHFNKNSLLKKDLDLYKALDETKNVTKDVAEKIVAEAKREKAKIYEKELFDEQSKLIFDVNKYLTSEVFSTFVPNYRSLATIYQLFDNKVPIQKRVMLESQIVGNMTTVLSEKQEEKIEPLDKLVYKTVINKFNSIYGSENTLLKEQKELINKYILSAADSAIDLKVYLNEELSRLKSVVTKSLNEDCVKNDNLMVEKTKEVLNIIEGFKTKEVDQVMLEQVLNIQQLVREIEKDDK
jgi:hypothetical protein